MTETRKTERVPGLSICGSVFLLDPRAQEPENYPGITGFLMTYRLLRGGFLGSPEQPFPMSGLMVAGGSCKEEDFNWDYGNGFPKFIGPAKEIITHVTGNNSYVGTMLFMNGTDSGPLVEGEEATFSFEGKRRLFSPDDPFISVYGVMHTAVEILGIEWIFGEILEDVEEFTWDSPEYDAYMDIPTVENGTAYNFIDIKVPKGNGPFPLILWIHGGAWTHMDRKSCIMSDTLDYLMSRGFAVASAEYTLSKCDGEGKVIKGSFPQDIYDLKAAIRFLRANAAKNRLDPGRIIAMGESAGGHLSLMLAVTNGNPLYEDLSMGNSAYSSDIQCAVSYFGPADCVGDPIMGEYLYGEGATEEQLRAASPLYQISEKTCPLYLTHGLMDTTVSFEHTKKMEEAAKRILGEDQVTAVYYEKGTHANRVVFDTEDAIRSVSAFLTARFL